MTTLLEQRYQQTLHELTAIGQQHVLNFWPRLTQKQKADLLDQCSSLDTGLLAGQVNLIKQHQAAKVEKRLDLLPFPTIALASTDLEQKRDQEAAGIGMEMLRQGKVAVLLVAGGQGSRMGKDEPKGMTAIGPVSGRSLFQFHTEKILALEKKYGRPVWFLIMTSESNHAAILSFFHDHQYFGKNPEQMVFFTQAMQPAFDEQGKLLMSSEYSLALSPDGHGGLLKALQRNRLLDKLQQTGVELLYYFQVDNVLCRIADPIFLGHHVLQQAEIASKSVAKRTPDEKVGVFCRLADHHPVVVEYFEFADELRTACDDQGRLIFNQGSIAIHVFSLAFLKRLLDQNVTLPYHVAHKKVPFIDRTGRPIIPCCENGYKLEQFIFDALSFARHTIVVEARREDEFSPVKNCKGEDSPDTARRALVEMFSRWFENIGISIPRDQNGHSRHRLEISPLYALNEVELRKQIPSDLLITDDLLFE
jgi:UDP-N-acetylglucosamine/UDP-N-acetylgalactosamine diphosphorylase